MSKAKVAVVRYGAVGQRLADGAALKEDMELVVVVDVAPTLAVLALYQVTDQLQSQAYERLHRATKSHGLAIYERLAPDTLDCAGNHSNVGIVLYSLVYLANIVTFSTLDLNFIQMYIPYFVAFAGIVLVALEPARVEGDVPAEGPRHRGGVRERREGRRVGRRAQIEAARPVERPRHDAEHRHLDVLAGREHRQQVEGLKHHAHRLFAQRIEVAFTHA